MADTATPTPAQAPPAPADAAAAAPSADAKLGARKADGTLDWQALSVPDDTAPEIPDARQVAIGIEIARPVKDDEPAATPPPVDTPAAVETAPADQPDEGETPAGEPPPIIEKEVDTKAIVDALLLERAAQLEGLKGRQGKVIDDLKGIVKQQSEQIKSLISAVEAVKSGSGTKSEEDLVAQLLENPTAVIDKRVHEAILARDAKAQAAQAEADQQAVADRTEMVPIAAARLFLARFAENKPTEAEYNSIVESIKGSKFDMAAIKTFTENMDVEGISEIIGQKFKQIRNGARGAQVRELRKKEIDRVENGKHTETLRAATPLVRAAQTQKPPANAQEAYERIAAENRALGI